MRSCTVVAARDLDAAAVVCPRECFGCFDECPAEPGALGVLSHGERSDAPRVARRVEQWHHVKADHAEQTRPVRGRGDENGVAGPASHRAQLRRHECRRCCVAEVG
jgi:hypothetical protein